MKTNSTSKQRLGSKKLKSRKKEGHTRQEKIRKQKNKNPHFWPFSACHTPGVEWIVLCACVPEIWRFLKFYRRCRRWVRVQRRQITGSRRQTCSKSSDGARTGICLRRGMKVWARWMGGTRDGWEEGEMGGDSEQATFDKREQKCGKRQGKNGSLSSKARRRSHA